MPQARGFTASLQAVSAVADQALEMAEGLTLEFTDGTADECAHAARRFQTTFSSMRAQERRRRVVRDQREHPEARDHFTQGKYDRLVCQRAPIPGGWRVDLIPASAALLGFKIIDRATGEMVTELGQGQSERDRLTDKAIFTPSAWTDADTARALEIDPDFFLTPEGKPWSPSDWLHSEEVKKGVDKGLEGE